MITLNLTAEQANLIALALKKEADDIYNHADVSSMEAARPFLDQMDDCRRMVIKIESLLEEI